MRSRVVVPLVLVCLAASCELPKPWLKDPGLGPVDFDVRCDNPDANHKFQEGVARLHHLDGHASKVFNATLHVEPQCTLAYWGIAMAQIRALGPAEPAPQAITAAETAVKRAREVGLATPRETAYLEAVAAFTSGGPDYDGRLAAWADAQERLAETYPKDVDALAFALLARLAVQDRRGESLEPLVSRAEALFREEPDHPGVLHALVIAGDRPDLARRAEPALEAYAGFAPEAPQAWNDIGRVYLHLGHFDRAIDAYLRAAAGARTLIVRGIAPADFAIALDHLLYAYLQTNLAARAGALPRQLEAAAGHEDALAAAKALAGIAARPAIEQGRWSEAAALPLSGPGGFPWERHPAGLAVLRFARGIGAARSGDLVAARNELAELEAIRDGLTDRAESARVESAAAGVAAWIALGTAEQPAAVSRLLRAADQEDSAVPDATMPALIPTREVLAEVLAAIGRHRDALVAYDASLQLRPDRRRSLLGAADSAEALGDLVRAGELRARQVAVAAKPASAQGRRRGQPVERGSSEGQPSR
jgi:tetratricopeptide (TPR) repeat protein